MNIFKNLKHLFVTDTNYVLDAVTDSATANLELQAQVAKLQADYDLLIRKFNALQAKVSVLELKLDSLADTGVDAFTDAKSKFHG